MHGQYDRKSRLDGDDDPGSVASELPSFSSLIALVVGVAALVNADILP